MTATSHPAAQRYAAHVDPAHVKLLGALGQARVYARGAAAVLWDEDGREYLDFAASDGAALLGHGHPGVVARLRGALAEDGALAPAAGIPAAIADLAADLARLVPALGRVTLAPCAAGAIDGALKLARAASRRKPLLYARGAYHGAGLGGLSLAGIGRVRDPFEPLLGDTYEVPFDDAEALERALSERKVAAVVLEPIQVEAGVLVPRRGYLRDVRRLCDKHGAMLVLDESRTGLGRTGQLFAHAEAEIVPDVLVVGEALGGGVASVAAVMTTPEVHDRAYGRLDRYDLQGSPWAVHPLACLAARATLSVIQDEELTAGAQRRGEDLLERLRDAVGQHPFVTSVRGRGLLVGIELGPARSGGLLGRLVPGLVGSVGRRLFGQWLALRLLERGIVCRPCAHQWNVLKLEPPLTVTDEQIDRAVTTTAGILGQYEELRPLLTDIGQRLGSQLLSGWTS